MTRLPTRLTRGACAAFCAAFIVLVPSAFAGHVPAKRAESMIGIHEGGYVVAGHTYTSLDAVDAALRSAGAGSVAIVACTPDATASWLAAVRRFDGLPMHLDVAHGSSPACLAALPASARPGAMGMDVDPATRQYWDARQP